MIKNLINTPCDIIILAGQSNSQGFGVGFTDEPYVPSADILALKNENAPTYVKDESGKDVFVCPESDYLIETAQEELNEAGENIACFALPFARKYKKCCLTQGRKIVIIKIGVGGTGFAHRQWGVGEPLFERLISMTDAAVSMNKDNKIVAFLWHQGECDAFERPELSPEDREKIHYQNLSTSIKYVRERYGNIPFIAGGFAEEWSAKFRAETEAVMSAIKSVCLNIGNAGFVSANDLKSNNQDTANGDDIHFSRDSLYILGNRYFEKYKEIVG